MTPFIQKRSLEAPENNPSPVRMPKKIPFFSKKKKDPFFQYQGNMESQNIDPFSAFLEQ